MIFTFDYDYRATEVNDFFNNADFDFKKYVSLKDYKLYIETDNIPHFLKYTEISQINKLFLVSVVNPLQTSEEEKLRRKDSDTQRSILRLCRNDVVKYYKDNVYFLNLNKDKALKISNDVGRIYYLGKYGRYRIYVSDNQYISNFVNTDEILISGSFFDCEREFNYQYLQFKDRIEKYTQTPYYENGVYYAPKILGKRFKGV